MKKKQFGNIYWKSIDVLNIYPKTSTAFLYYKFQLILLSINGSGVKYFAVNLKVWSSNPTVDAFQASLCLNNFFAFK